MNVMSFSASTRSEIRNGRIRLGYVDTTCEDSWFGAQHPGGQGAALEILVFTLGALAGGITSGFLSSVGAELYEKLKSFFQNEAKGITALRAKRQQHAWNIFCYAFVFEIENLRVVVAYDVATDDDLEFCVVHGKDDVIAALTDGLANIPNDKDVFEIDVEIRRDPDSISVTHRWRTTSQKELWLNNIVEIRTQ